MKTRTKPSARVVAASLLLATLAACGRGPSSAGPADSGQSSETIVGNWKGDNGTTVVVAADGHCTGLYYDADGQPVDTGAEMTCSYSKHPTQVGNTQLPADTHALVVQQPPNEVTLQVLFTDPDTVQVWMVGEQIPGYTLTTTGVVVTLTHM